MLMPHSTRVEHQPIVVRKPRELDVIGRVTRSMIDLL